MHRLRLATLVIFAISVFCASAGIPSIGSLHVLARSVSGEPAGNSAMLPFGNASSSHQQRRRADRVIATKVIKGTVDRFERGDYLWVVVKDSAGKELEFDMPNQRSLQYFLAEHKGKPLVITDQIVSRYIPEAGSRMRIDTIKAVRYEEQTVANWWKEVRAKSTLAQLKEKYDKLIDEYTVTP